MNKVFTEYYNPGGGGGGYSDVVGRGCAAEASKPVPIFKGHFGGKGYPLLGIFSQEMMFMCTLATKWRNYKSGGHV